MNMRCLGKFKDDRLCDLCEMVDAVKYEECKNETEAIAIRRRKLYDIKGYCKYSQTAYDERIPFDSCNKNGKGYGRHADVCIPTEDCEKYRKEE